MELLIPHSLDRPPLLPAPAAPADWPAWRQHLLGWRAQAQQALAYDDARYRAPAFQWAAGMYACGFVFMYDSAFYDPHARHYTVAALLAQAAEKFGGYDAVVLWHAYPRLGFDARNQFDCYRDMPGGLAGVRAACQQFQARGVRVFLNYNPWDTGTRREPQPDSQALANLLGELGADGLFLDTMSRGAGDLRARLDGTRPGLALESEGALPLAAVHDHHLSWAQRFVDSAAPGVLRNKWFERRHMQHLISRWQRDHSAELHTAWMNGCGLIVWENVFGTWVGWNARDRACLRLMLPIQRRYHALFSGGEWTPLVETRAPNVYASQWAAAGLRLWTLVNRSETVVQGALLQVAHPPGTEYWDLVNGQPLAATLEAGQAELAGEIGPRGLGAILAGPPAALGPDLAAFIDQQRALLQRASAAVGSPALATRRRAVAPTARAAGQALAPGMVAIPGATLNLRTVYRVRECGFDEPVANAVFDAPYLHTQQSFQRPVTLSAFAMDVTPVTNAQFSEFLSAAGYRPEAQENFLRHWPGGRLPAGLEEHPVVYVDLSDARAYARWAGKRLPTEAEWQYAAEGPQARRYPWGDALTPGACNDGSRGGTTPVRAYPAGRSPFGCYDMCGNVWQWTESEASDGRTRFCIVRGGSYYKALGSDWYADGGPLPANFAAKFLLLWPGLDRCATIGFRCCVDL